MKKHLLMYLQLFLCAIQPCYASDMVDPRHPDSIILLQNINPAEWQYLEINDAKLDELAASMAKLDLKIADWEEMLPDGLNIQEAVEYIMGFICIDFCHWGQNSHNNTIYDFYAKDHDILVRGSSAMIVLAKRAHEAGAKIFDANFMKRVTVDQLRPYFMGLDKDEKPIEMPWLMERVKILNEVGHILQDHWQASFYNIFHAAHARAFNNGKGFVELLVKYFPRFKDEYKYKNNTVGIYKLAQLSVLALQSALRQRPEFLPFKDCASLTLCADYQIPKMFRAGRVLEYSFDLASLVDHEKLIAAGSLPEMEIRMATVFAGHQLKERINTLRAHEGKPLITSQELDYALWTLGRELDPKNKRHLTRTIMY